MPSIPKVEYELVVGGVEGLSEEEQLTLALKAFMDTVREEQMS